MKLIKPVILAITASTILTACTDAEFDRQLRWSNPTKIECYQYNTKVLEDESTGKVEFATNGSGFYYRSRITNKLVQTINLNCTIKEI